MNEQDNRRNMMYGNNQAVTQLNKVPGFDPLQFLRPAISEKTQEKLMKLDLRYQKLWFRLAHPQGRMKLTALRITQQMAIFEAKVFLDRSDTEPVSSLVASLTRQDTLNYIKEAQDTALSTALENAGFGLQFADVSVGKGGERYGSVIPVTNVQGSENPPAKEVPAQAARTTVEAPHASVRAASVETPKTPQSAPVAVEMTHSKEESESVVQSQNVAVSLPVSGGKVEQEEKLLVGEVLRKPVLEENLPVIPKAQANMTERQPVSLSSKAAEMEEQLPVAPSAKTEQKESLPITSAVMPTQTAQVSAESRTLPFVRPATDTMTMTQEPAVKVQSMPTSSEASAPVQEQKAESAVAPRYTADMPVDDIAALMTEEEAREVKVDTGICNGWTIGQVADQRTPSLKYYLYGYKGNNNILRAAAKVMLESLTEQKAG